MGSISSNNIVVKAFIVMFYLFIFFPFVQIVPLPTDIQPYAMMFSIILLFMFFLHDSKIKFPIEIMMLLPPLLLSIIIGAYEFNFNSIRGAANYISLFCIALATYNALETEKTFSDWTLKTAVWIWLVIGLVQKFIYPKFMTFLLYMGRGSAEGGRGVISLAPEPTFYGIICIFFLLLNFHYHNNKWILVILLGQLIYLSMSSMAILFCILFGIYYFFIYMVFFQTKMKSTLIVILSMFFIGLFVFQSGLISDSRVGKLIALSIDDPSYILLVDPSGNDRFAHIFFSTLGMFQNYFLPHGFNAWNDQVLALISRYGEYFGDITTSNRIMSGYGAALFELGAVGLFVPLSITLSLYNFHKNDIRRVLLFALFVNTILFSAIQLSFPFVGFLIGFMSYVSRHSLISER